MAQLRRDPVTGRWIIISMEDEKLPSDYAIEGNAKKGGTCPFCPGNENMTPPEIDAHREGGTKKNTPGWSTRVIPNKYPALRVEGNLDRSGIGIYDMMNGVGAHEVIIENPDHYKEIPDMFDHEVEKIIWSYRNRSLDLRGDKRFKYVMIFKNYGFSAGASLEHSHSQLIALPIVPKRVLEELTWSSRYYEYRERCVFCDILRQEMQDNERIIAENKSFISFCPYVSRFPFEIWILPKEHNPDFTLIKFEQILDLARMVKETLHRVRNVLSDVSYNYIVHTSPIEPIEREDYHWHIEIMPKLTKVAGFEWGTGFYYNTTSPETASKFLREVKI